LQSVKADNYGRRTWNTVEYEKAAKSRELAEKALEAARQNKAKEQHKPYDLYAGKRQRQQEDDLSSSEDEEGGFDDWDFPK